MSNLARELCEVTEPVSCMCPCIIGVILIGVVLYICLSD